MPRSLEKFFGEISRLGKKWLLPWNLLRVATVSATALLFSSTCSI
ncbi:hypothetical protein [Gulosibacter sediminis]|nr:hypothetical protein [Gulosibacter sediminis]